ncbi:MAG: cytochrome C [Gammaproteobacteria bacterium]|nr:cytochrome C [Gammaproteobacteria bacterium]
MVFGFLLTATTLLLTTACSEQSDPGAETTAAAPATDRPSVRRSEQAYMDFCASCHGPEGRGDGPLATELRKEPSNLRLLKANNDGIFPTRKVQSMVDGRAMPRAHGTRDMPVWGRYWKEQGLATSEGELQARVVEITSYLYSIQE